MTPSQAAELDAEYAMLRGMRPEVHDLQEESKALAASVARFAAEQADRLQQVERAVAQRTVALTRMEALEEENKMLHRKVMELQRQLLKAIPATTLQSTALRVA